MAWLFPTADLNNCSNLAWSDAVMKERRMLGIFEAAEDLFGADGCRAEPRNESAIWEDVKPVCCGACLGAALAEGCGGAWSVGCCITAG
jgi:hypothetical protein